jgi:hypothetical protein
VVDSKRHDGESAAESLDLQYDYKEDTGKATITRNHGLDFKHVGIKLITATTASPSTRSLIWSIIRRWATTTCAQIRSYVRWN